MCELLVWVHDKEDGGNPLHDLVKYRRGDVIAAMPDGYDWTEMERRHPKWIILKVPDMPLAEGRALASDDLREPTRHLYHMRPFHLHLEHEGAHPLLKSIVARANAGVNLPLEIVSAAHLRAIRRRKPFPQDPRVVGEHTQANVLG